MKGENRTYSSLSNTAKTIQTGNFRALSLYIKISKRTQINNLMIHHKALEKQEQTTAKCSKQREIEQSRD